MKTPAEKPSARMRRFARQRTMAVVRRSLWPELTQTIEPKPFYDSEFQRRSQSLIAEWGRTAQKKFADAKHEETEFGRRFIEHGAVNIYNCIQDLKRALQR